MPEKGDLSPLDEITCWYSLDVIGAVTFLDARLQSQRRFNPLASALRHQLEWHVLESEYWLRWNPARLFVQWYNNCFYLLASHPEAMSKLRAEHDAVLDSVTETAQKLREHPHLLNRLPYTTTVIKEVLRRFPPAPAMRGRQRGVYLKGRPGKPVPNREHKPMSPTLGLTASPSILDRPARFPTRALACLRTE
ncbi:hypothetical protein VMCG_03394 [Cytospora schulzeri]|uniref:Uncharacterized protein n=1 Tax=Cytospora schulzeri TaxID=448051 RepID=A0A423WWQ8_9PEZI|nr:hypothetical protein VMCG_03394 [Valsa malicola]